MSGERLEVGEDGQVTGIHPSKDEYSQWNCQLQVIRSEDLNPGDVVMVKCSRVDMNNAAAFFDQVFRPRGVTVLVMPLEFDVRITAPKPLVVKE